jgi:hypothetical protein
VKAVNYGLQIGEPPYYKTQARRPLVAYVSPLGDSGVALAVAREPGPGQVNDWKDEQVIRLTVDEARDLAVDLLQAAKQAETGK